MLNTLHMFIGHDVDDDVVSTAHFLRHIIAGTQKVAIRVGCKLSYY